MGDILVLTMQHIYMVITAVVISCIIAIPLAIFIYKKNLYTNHILNFISLLQSVPSLAIYAILVPFIGIGTKLAVTTLVVYCILPIFLNTINGFKTIDKQDRDLMESLNLDERTKFVKVELPLALVSIVNGVRLTTIYAISLTTIATLVGAGGLGDLIYLGLQQLDLKLTFMGVIPLIVLTVVANFIFNIIEAKVTPIHLQRGHADA